MIPLKELKLQLNINPSECVSMLRYLNTQVIDFDVYLPTKSMNLQRPFVWDINQKRELINSILIGRHIPHCAIILNNDESWQVIDGKQRLSTMIEFVNDNFTLLIDNVKYFYSELPIDYQRQIICHPIRYYRVCEMDSPITDEDKINWFKFINFAGTIQDKEHLTKFD